MEDWVLPVIDLTKCNRCGVCVEVCPTQALEMTDEGPVFTRPEACTFCTDCENRCPQGAILCRFEIGWAPGAG